MASPTVAANAYASLARILDTGGACVDARMPKPDPAMASAKEARSLRLMMRPAQ